MVPVLFIIFVASAASLKTVPPIKCGVNEYAVACKTICPPQNCDISYTDYACEKNQKCIPGCDCIKDHLRNNENICVFNENCPPPPSAPEEPSNIPQQPPKNTCNPSTSSENKKGQSSSQSSSTASTSSSSSSSHSSSSSQSFASSQTSSSSSTNGNKGGGNKRSCTYNKCTPTCSLPFPQKCPSNSNPCNCPPGTIISEEGGECVPTQECEKYINCKGDYNARYTEYPIGCPSTCAKPNAEYCHAGFGTLECACKPGYILREKNGKCIKVEDCPGGNVCRKNETFAYCGAECPNNYCPTNDNRDSIICSTPFPCPSRCVCLGGYRRKSTDENICILASDCPPVKCTRPNEEWNSCTGWCFSDRCGDNNRVNLSGVCNSFGPDCNPQCVCKKGFCRNETDRCVKA